MGPSVSLQVPFKPLHNFNTLLYSLPCKKSWLTYSCICPWNFKWGKALLLRLLRTMVLLELLFYVLLNCKTIKMVANLTCSCKFRFHILNKDWHSQSFILHLTLFLAHLQLFCIKFLLGCFPLQENFLQKGTDKNRTEHFFGNYYVIILCTQ